MSKTDYFQAAVRHWKWCHLTHKDLQLAFNRNYVHIL